MIFILRFLPLLLQIIMSLRMATSGKKPVGPPFPLFTRFPSKIERAGYKLYNYVDNSLYPVRPFYFGVSLAASAAYFSRFEDSSTLLQLVPKFGEGTAAQCVRVGIVSLTTVSLPVIFTRFILRHFYFKYKRWLFENPKKPSTLTKVWGMLRSLLSLSPPLLKSCDALLPSLPVPALEETVQRYLESIRHLHSKEELAAIDKMADDFLKGEGPKVQRFTKLYSLFTDNYVTDFWEKYAYLYTRSSLMINSSVAHVDLFVDTPATQAVRAAHIAYTEFLSHLAIDRQTYTPLGGGLVCACHYDKMYAVARVPGEKIDHLENHGISRHVLVLFNGGIYRVDVVDEKDRIYSIDQLTDIFIELLTRPDTKVEGAEGRVPALTHDKRSEWHVNRHRFFECIPRNKKALKEIESAAFVISLTSEENWDYDLENRDTLSRFMKSMLTGEGANRWVDKSLNYIVGRNGRCGGTTEHSIADGSEFDHIMENFVWMENEIVDYPPLDVQLAREKSFNAAEAEGRVKFAERIEIEVTQEMGSEIDRCFSSHESSSRDVDMASLVFRNWGKGRIKKCGCSPDAFVQMAIQLANYRDQGRFVLTYEAASSRFFANSRTETLRSVTDASCEFVRSMQDGGKADRAQRASLLRKACELHSTHNRDCMVNKGVDRHLFVLFVMSQATGTSSPFLNHYIQQEWLLSTSHVPNVTNTMKEDGEFVDKSWLGASFGAVAQTGYGVCYRFAGNHSICAHISSYHSARNTDSYRFRHHLERAFLELSALFD
ncbi:hypothetical protein PMAYCL1PPCAC_29042 [Pristionchus mayeri]|uniref:Choline/carnitine acyltransferase domain-containing protein n=1 Tax=Pristionchus mayeri TaxID=1317129 RepID=A0AAN5DA54_9BILA|nr:hypothetical protein PMAYCL1PPCAC_29042 [Pristionchus mayeri]